MLEVSRDYLKEIVSPQYKGRVILCGGIQINMPRPCDDYFEPYFFEVYEDGKKVRDLMHAFKAELKYDWEISYIKFLLIDFTTITY